MEAVAIIESVVSGLLLAGLLGTWGIINKFIKEQKKTNELMNESIASMQREVIVRAFQRHVEDKKPMSLEELEHLDACYEAYIASGHNGPAKIMYEKIQKFAVVTTKKSGSVIS